MLTTRVVLDVAPSSPPQVILLVLLLLLVLDDLCLTPKAPMPP
ncbi:hypothetical protein [Prosthecobacter sp.]|nr:hypothetical protein [Prosthecobacter sp.]